jgi:hypothetical protein
MRMFMATLAAAAALGLSLPAEAQNRQRPPAEITIVNARDVALVSLEIASTGENPRLVGRVTQGIQPGRSAKLRLNRPTGCSFVIIARFADDSEAESDGTNLCGETQLRLTE